MTKKADAKTKTTTKTAKTKTAKTKTTTTKTAKAAKPAPIKPKSKALSPLIARTVQNAIAAHKQAGADALLSIEQNRRSIAESFFDIATDLSTLRRKEVYSAMGHASFDEVIPLTGLARTTAYALLKLPQHLTRHTAIALGPEKSAALIRYVQSTEEDDDAETLARQDVSIAGKPISALSTQELEQAARDALPVEKRKKLPGEKEAHSTRHAVAQSLASLKADVRVKRVKGKWIAVVEVPVEAALKLTAKR